jgi:hypothetical protein
MLREQDGGSLATMGVENEGESGDTTHPTQLNPRRHEPLELQGGSHFQATPLHPCEVSWCHLLPTKIEGGTLQGKNSKFQNMCV